ncbi:DUF317 domain-containing protein [Streptomyces sp. NPDC018833]|uniref:DUF317 domain-containing protein n=1 Tax=Streptomyces sp. NPDC018833 TaxID=3365053 RepID=UPI0037A52193
MSLPLSKGPVLDLGETAGWKVLNRSCGVAFSAGEPHWRQRFSTGAPTALVAAFTASQISTEPVHRMVKDAPFHTGRHVYVAPATTAATDASLPSRAPRLARWGRRGGAWRGALARAVVLVVRAGQGRCREEGCCSASSVFARRREGVMRWWPSRSR